MSTPFHAKYWAVSLRLVRPHDAASGLARSIANARVDLNPHQVDAAIFALRSPFSKGVLLADEVGLGKTIEAGLVLSQRWAERRRRILLVVPATLRKQWAIELETKFHLPTTILETKTFNDQKKKGKDPFAPDDERVVICSYQFVYARRAEVAAVAWDLVVADEAHRLRNVYKEPKTIKGIVDAIRPARKLLLTATPLQNSLLELYGLVSILDPELFGGQDAFQAQFVGHEDPEERNRELRKRIHLVYTRTLRKQVLEYVKFTDRRALTVDFVPSPDEQRLYDQVSEYLQRDELVALPNAQRKLVTLILRKLLASSSAAIGATLAKFSKRLEGAAQVKGATKQKAPIEELAEDFEAAPDLEDEWEDEPTSDNPADPFNAAAELSDLQAFVALARSIPRDAKAGALLGALKQAFGLATAKGALEKAVVFTESCQTQKALFQLLSANGYAGKIVLMNGSNTDEVSKNIYVEWKKRNEARWHEVSSGARTADMKAAIVEEFRDRGTILLATESAAEGVNLQFCSIVVNYDLPWNPQRIEQRIGRCHRYGQRCEVLVVNFLNRTNAADARVFELLSQKFRLFEGVFGASDDILGAVESGVDLEKSIADIYQNCRTPNQIQAAFDDLQTQLDAQIKARLADTKKALLENVDEEVVAKLKFQAGAARGALDEQQRVLLDLARFELAGRATFSDDEPRFEVTKGGDTGPYHLDWKRAEELGCAFFRPDGPLPTALVQGALSRPTEPASVDFTFEARASALDRWRGCSGWLSVERLETTVAGRAEEHLLVAAMTDEGEKLPADAAARFFALPGSVANGTISPPPHLSAFTDEIVAARLGFVEKRTTQFLDEEEEKLERWAEDLKAGLEQRIRTLDREIPLLKKASKKLATLAERVNAQKPIVALEAERTKCRKDYFERLDEIDKKREALLDSLQKQVAEKRAERTHIFTLRWKLS